MLSLMINQFSGTSCHCLYIEDNDTHYRTVQEVPSSDMGRFAGLLLVITFEKLHNNSIE